MSAPTPGTGTDLATEQFRNASNVEIDSAADPITIKAASAGRRWVCTYLFLQTEADGDLRVKSGSTNLTGLIEFKDPTIPGSNQQREREWGGRGIPVFKGGTNEAMTISNPDAVQVNGFAVVMEVILE